MTPLFFFDGQSIVGKEELALRGAVEAVTKNNAAWEPYLNNQAAEAVKAFGKSGMTPMFMTYQYSQRC